PSAIRAKTAPRVRPLIVCWTRTSHHSIGQSKGASTAPSEPPPRNRIAHATPALEVEPRTRGARFERVVEATSSPSERERAGVRAGACSRMVRARRGWEGPVGRPPPARLLEDGLELELAAERPVRLHHLEARHGV